MPVAGELRHLYRTESWRALVELLRRRSGNRCELVRGTQRESHLETMRSCARMGLKKNGRPL